MWLGNSNKTRANKTSSADRAAEQLMLQRLVKGDQQVWSDFYKRYRPLITRCVVRALRRCNFIFTEADLEDIVAEVWVALLRYDRLKLRRFDSDRAGLTNWLGVLATNCTIDHIRGRWASKRRPVTIEPQSSWQECPEPEARLELHQQASLARRAASELDQRDQQFLTLCMDDRVTADLARELGVAVSTIHTRKFRLCQKLSRLVGQMGQQRPALAV